MECVGLREIRCTLAESQDLGLLVKLTQASLDEGKEVADTVESEGRRYRIEGKLLPTPHVEITPVDN